MTTAFKLADKVAAFIDKLKLWDQRVNKGVFDMFQTLAKTLKGSEPEQVFSYLVSSHLHTLLVEFKRYFPSAKDPRNDEKLVMQKSRRQPQSSVTLYCFFLIHLV